MRIQILELPAEYVGEHSTIPFALIVDEVMASIGEAELQLWSELGKDCGAKHILVTGETVEIVR